MKLVSRALAAALLVAAAGSPVYAQGKQGKKVTVTGCPYPGVLVTCLMIKDKDGAVYNITGANPRPELHDVAIIVTGTISSKLSICNQGFVLDDIKWDRTKMRCPKP